MDMVTTKTFIKCEMIDDRGVLIYCFYDENEYDDTRDEMFVHTVAYQIYHDKLEIHIYWLITMGYISVKRKSLSAVSVINTVNGEIYVVKNFSL